ncbi:MAG: YkgJ family cysteine cluster protein [Rhodomicrobium sp.]
MTADDDFDGEEQQASPEAGYRATLDRDQKLNVFDSIRAQSENPVEPVKLAANDTFRFRCHRGVSCWNVCCHGADITLPPYDILRLSRRFGMRPAEFLEKYTVPAEHDGGVPIVKLKMSGGDGKGACHFLAEEGCTVYADRPAACRYYPLGLISVKLKDSEAKEDFHFLVREDHCRGHDEAQTQTVAEFCKDQGLEHYEQINRGWIDILMKLASWRPMGGPMGKTPSPQARQMFFMVSTDVDRFRKFVFESRFLSVYDIPQEALELVKTSDEALLLLGLDWMKNVLFNEPTIAMRHEVLQGAIAQARSQGGEPCREPNS